MPRRFIDYNEVKLQIIFNRHVQANTRTKFALQKANKLPVLKYPRLLLFYDRFILSDEDDNWVLRFNESDEEGDELGVNPHCNENNQEEDSSDNDSCNPSVSRHAGKRKKTEKANLLVYKRTCFMTLPPTRRRRTTS